MNRMCCLSFMMVALSSPFSSLGASSEGESLARSLIDAQLLVLSPSHEACNVVSVGSAIGNMNLYTEPPEDPTGALRDCFVFTTRLRFDINVQIGDSQAAGSARNMVGVFKNGNIVWISDSTITEEDGELFTIRDINIDGRVEIVTRWDGPRTDKGTSQLWIHSWDGQSGEMINATTADWIATSVISGQSDGFVLFDAEGDGVLEIKNVSVTDGSLTWSWDGSQYGAWPTTPHLPETTWWPRNHLSADVHVSVCRIEAAHLQYQYFVQNSEGSRQRLNFFLVGGVEDSVQVGIPPGWQRRLHSTAGTQGWETPPFDHRHQILPGSSTFGFSFSSRGLPNVRPFYVKGYNDVPNPELMSVEEYADRNTVDLVQNSFVGYTVAPTDHYDRLTNLALLDTLRVDLRTSSALDWIFDPAFFDRNDLLLSSVRAFFENGDLGSARNSLRMLLQEVERDSGTVLSSEAHALLKYNTEYLLDRLGAVSPPVLAALTPGMTLTGSGPFDLVVTGTGFADGAAILWNGNACSTQFVSSTTLKTRIGGGAVTSPVSAGVTVRNPDGTTTGHLTFAVVAALPAPLRPVLECVTRERDDAFVAWFGYRNDNPQSVYLPVGRTNSFAGIPKDRGQTTLFLPGRTVRAFSVPFTGSNLTWTLNGRTSTASKKSPRCR